jgi:hypothetical protein
VYKFVFVTAELPRLVDTNIGKCYNVYGYKEIFSKERSTYKRFGLLKGGDRYGAFKSIPE